MGRILSLTLLFGLLTAATSAQDILKQRVDLLLEDELLEEALYLLVDDYGVPLSFSNDILPRKYFSVRFENRSLQFVLDFLLRGTPIRFRQMGDQIVLYRSKSDSPVQEPSLFTISGFVKDGESGEHLIGATVIDRRSGLGTQTNEYGFFSLSLPAGEVDFFCSYLGYKAEQRNFRLYANQHLAISLRTSLILTEVLVLAGDSTLVSHKTGYSVNWIDKNDSEGLPLLGGEPDVMRTAQYFPGVQTGTDGIGGLFVRGGDAGHNLVLLDGVPVYNLTHGAGLFSIFNTQAIKSAQFIRGAFPARFGGRLASVLDIRTRDGNSREFHGEAGMGLLTARAMFEGPIVPEKSSFLISGRTSFLNWYLMPLARRYKSLRGEDGSTGYQFHDLTVKLNWMPNTRDKLYFSLYNGGDYFTNYGETHRHFTLPSYYGEDTLQFQFDRRYSEQLEWGNTIAAIRWNRLFSPQLFANATLTYSRLGVEVGFSSRDSLLQRNPFQLLGQSLNFGRYHSGIRDLGARIDFDWVPTPKHYVRFGGALTHHRLNPGILQYDGKTQELVSGNPQVPSGVHLNELALYAEDDMQVNERLSFNFGLRLSLLQVEQRLYGAPEPRFAFSWLMDRRTTLRGAVGTSTQSLHLLSSSNLGLPVDLWIPSTRQLAPQQSQQLSLGIDRRMGPTLSLSLEGYYKHMNRLVTYQDGAYFLDDWRKSVTTGKGHAYGLEIMLRQSGRRTTGWVAYSLARTDRRFTDINYNQPYPFRYDRRHDLKVAVRHTLNNWLELSGDWVYGTGLAFSFPVNVFQLPYAGLPFENPNVLVYFGKNNFRLPPFHRLNLGMNAILRGDGLEHQISAGFYNIYNRLNPLYYDLKTEISSNGRELVRSLELRQVTLLPLLPYVNYSIKF